MTEARLFDMSMLDIDGGLSDLDFLCDDTLVGGGGGPAPDFDIGRSKSVDVEGEGRGR